jgi:hypothetical protein
MRLRREWSGFGLENAIMEDEGRDEKCEAT